MNHTKPQLFSISSQFLTLQLLKQSSKAVAFFSLLALCLGSAFAQDAPKEWAWMSGSSSEGQSGVYGTMGTPADKNYPGGRSNPITWVDRDGNLWLFGGCTYDATGNFGQANDLWMYDRSTNKWTWIGGSNLVDQTGVYGTQGVPSAGNIPGGRNSSVSWIDTKGNVWLFGGAGYDSRGYAGYLNDLWKFDPSTKQWTWISGTTYVYQNGVYGTLGTSSVTNTPGSRYLAMSWLDSKGNLWLFGGYGEYSYGNLGRLNDLWKFDPTTSEWTWMGGTSTSNSNGGVPGTYGQLGTPADGNIPGSRERAAGWTDSKGNLWLFGGLGFDANGTVNDLNDLWMFNPSTNQWAWMGGSKLADQPGTYGTAGVPASDNIPGSRQNALTWVDTGGDFWLFGGASYDSTRTNESRLNDFWTFDPVSLKWTFVSGHYYAQPGQYGTLGIPDPANTPGSRDASGVWTDPNGYLWIFGGLGHDASGLLGELNDLWKYQPYSPAPAPVFSVSSGTYNATQTIEITDAAANATIYYTTDGSTPTVNSSVYRTPISLDASGTIKAMATAPGYILGNVATATYTIIYPAASPTFAPAGGTFTSAQTVTIGALTPGSTIYYTMDGSTPTASSSVYTGPITISSSQTINAFAVAPGYIPSAVASAAYVITNPGPVLKSTAPGYASAGGNAFTLTVNGADFRPNSTIYWGTTALATTYVSAAQLTASVSAASIASPGIQTVTVQTPAPGGGTSNSWQFEIDSTSSSTSAPTITATISTVTAGATASYAVSVPASVTNVTLNCLNLPSGASCKYDSGVMTIATSSSTPKGTYQITVVLTETITKATTAATVLPLLFLPLVSFQKKNRTRRSICLVALFAFILAAVASLTTGCGGTSSAPQQPTPSTTQMVSSGVASLTVQ